MEEVKKKRGRPRKQPTPTPVQTPASTPTPPARVQDPPGEGVARREKAPYGCNLPQNTFLRDLPAGSTSKYLANALRKWDLPKIDISDPKQVRERIEWYFRTCVEDDVRPTPGGLCNSLDISQMTLCNWRNGVQRRGEHTEIILQAYDVLEELWEHYMNDGKINPVAGIFLGKTLYGKREEQNIVISAKHETAYDVDVDALEAKYNELPPVEDSD